MHHQTKLNRSLQAVLRCSLFFSFGTLVAPSEYLEVVIKCGK